MFLIYNEETAAKITATAQEILRKALPVRHYIFLDDERFPNENTFPDAGKQVIHICRNTYQAQQIFLNSRPGDSFVVSFDHDLGDRYFTGYDFAWWLVEQDLNGEEWLNEHFEFYVHSQNPVGKRNIEALLTRYMAWKSENPQMTSEFSYNDQ